MWLKPFLTIYKFVLLGMLSLYFDKPTNCTVSKNSPVLFMTDRLIPRTHNNQKFE